MVVGASPEGVATRTATAIGWLATVVGAAVGVFALLT